MTSPRLSILAPNFNHARFLPEMIDSCLEQSLQDWELIIIDDASTDNSVEIASDYVRRDARVKLLRNAANMGAIPSVNVGFRAAKGDYVFMRSADDINLPGYFETAVKLLVQHPEAAFFCGDIAYFRNDPRVCQVETLGIGREPDYYPPSVLIERLGSTPIHGHTVVFRRELLAQAGFYRESHRWYADWFPNMGWAFRRGVCYSPTAMMGCRLLSESYGNKGPADESLKMATVSAILNDLVSFFPDVVPSLRKAGSIGFFGSTGAKVLAQDERLRLAFEGSTRKPNETNGLSAVISSVLSEHAPAIRQKAHEDPRFRIWFYGAGLHTELLLGQWEQRGLPRPAGIFVSQPPGDTVFLDLPLKHVVSVLPGEVDMVVVSSKSYEETMLAVVGEKFPTALVITFWDKTRTLMR